MAESCECLLTISGHGKMNLSFYVVPIEGDPAIFGSFPIFGYFIVLLQNFDEVVGMLFSNVFDSKIVDY